jgi:plastocyanin
MSRIASSSLLACVIAVIAVPVTAAGCGGDDGGNGSSSQANEQPSGPTGGQQGSGSPASGGREGAAGQGERGEGAGEQAAEAPAAETISMGEFEFDPRRASVERGVTLTVRNEGSVPHNLTIEEGPDPEAPSTKLVATSTIPGGKSERLPIELPSGRRYVMVCTVPGHREAGMVGTIRVRE